MDLHCLGLNHRTTPIGVREKFWFSADEVRSILLRLKETGVRESVLLSTCNRTELYYVADETVSETDLQILLASEKQELTEIAPEYFYAIPSLHAANHLLKLASGVDSMVLGDIQIMNQIKSAFALAQDAKSAGLILNRLFNNAIHTGKRARTETEISRGAVSVGYAAAELASKIYHDLSEKTALLIGAGETGALTAKHLSGHNLGRLMITNRTREKAKAFLNDLPGTVIDFDRLNDYLPEVDIIISSISTTSYILRAVELMEAMKTRKNRPLFIIDLGMPRNIDPLAGSIENVFLHDIDDLFHIVDKNLESRKREVPNVNAIVLHELKQFDGWYKSLQITPTIQQLRTQFEEIRKAEVEKYLHRFNSETQDEISLITTRIINKILHAPTTNLRKETAGGSDSRTGETIHLLRTLFDLDSNARR